MNAMRKVSASLRYHLPFLVIIPALIIAMTYPTIIHVFDTSTFWAPSLDLDIWKKFWDAWHFGQVLAGESGFYHTDLLYYPAGVPLIYQTYSLPHLLVLNILQLFLPQSNAYCLTFMLNSFCCALTAYIYCMYLFKDRWLALLGAVIFGLSQQAVGKVMEPDTSVIFTLPLTLYFLHRGLDEGRTKWLAIGGALLGFTAYCGMYIFVCNAMAVAFFLLCFAWAKWRDKTFWRGIAVMGALAFVICAGRVLPMLSDPNDLDRAIQDNADAYDGSDLIGFVVNYRHPILTPLFHTLAGIEANPPSPHTKAYLHGEVLRWYTGITTLLLIGIGLLRKSSRGLMLPWLPMAAFFMILRLGPVLQINGIEYRDILLPKYYLDRLLPTIFAAFHGSGHFHIGALLPLAVLACYGLRSILPATKQNIRIAIVLALVAVIAFETYFLPFSKELGESEFDYINWLKAQEDQESIRLAPLPMHAYGYGHGQFHMIHQTRHGYPITGGHITRVSSAAHRFVEANPLLHAASRDESMVCSQSRQDEVFASLDQLEAAGISHVVLHQRVPGAAPILAAFADMRPAYADWHTFVYEVSRMRQHCQNPPPGTDSLSLYLELVYGKAIPPRDAAVLTFHPSEGIHDEALRYLSWNNDFGQNLNHLTLDSAGTFTLQSTNPQIETIDDFIDREAALLLLNHPADAEPYHAAFADWLASHYRLCGRLIQTDHIAIDYHLRHELPCELAFAPDKMRVRYDNGSRLRNRAFDINGSDLRLHLWWRIADGPKISYSIQLFDAAGDKARQIDHVMNRMMKSHRLDLTGLPQGEYHARMIVYDFETGKSHGGEIVADSTRFSRDIEIARFTLGE